MRTAVDAAFVGRERVFNRRFLQMCSHYLVEPTACTPASGWEKGRVENQVNVVRERFFKPRLHFAGFTEMNAWLLERCVAYAVVDLVNRLEAENKAGQAGMIADTRTRLGLLVLNELGYLPFAQSGGQLLFHLISRLYERTSVVITTNRDFAEWLTISRTSTVRLLSPRSARGMSGATNAHSASVKSLG